MPEAYAGRVQRAGQVGDRVTGPVTRRVQERLARASEVEPWLRSLVLRDVEGALRRAADLDADAALGRPRGELHGVVVAVKDNVDVAGQVTACGSRTHDGRPAQQDAPVVARLRAAGAVVLGRANMDELAMGASTATSAYGPTRNPWDPARSPGGSSGGCAAAVAAGIADLAVGTDTGGSVREPAAQCGVWGLAASPGLVPVEGIVPFAPSCDRTGLLADDPALLARALRVASAAADAETHPPRRVGVVAELCGAPNQAGVLTAFAVARVRLEAAGVEVAPVSIPDAGGALAAYMTLTSVEALPWLRRRVATGRAGAEVVRRAALAESLEDRAIAAAERVRERLREQTGAALTRVDALLCPTLPTTAPRFAPAGPATADVADPLHAPYTDCWTVVANLAGLPSLSAPVGLSPEGLPVGAMLTGAVGSEELLLAAGVLASERLRGLGDRRPA